MKNILFTTLMLSSGVATYGQPTYEVLKDPVTQEKMFVGSVQKKDIANNPDFSWYAESQKIYPEPNAAAVKAMQQHKSDIYFVIFGGTWCEDTHFVLPKFFKIQEEAGFPENHISLFAVDRDKKMPNPIAAALNVHNVPTIIVMKDGKELGRVVEYGKTGYWDKELADVINSGNNTK